MSENSRYNHTKICNQLEKAADDGDLSAGRRSARPIFDIAVNNGTVEAVAAALSIFGEFFPEDVDTQRSCLMQRIIDRGLTEILGAQRIVLATYLRERGLEERVSPSVFGKAVRAQYMRVHDGATPPQEETTLPFGRRVPVAVYTTADAEIIATALNTLVPRFPRPRRAQ
ncbi:hypothetical protein [Corynebacterium sp. AOP12-C2-36]|uniref:hypothetical protein n=1 Tax=Corynebacterium sp. AOP12-C2-36 TaxID=3457723 RepID=UPI004034A5FD